jgi:hypothetical protein
MSAAAVVWTTLIGILAYVLAVEPLFFNYMLLQVLRLVAAAQRSWMWVCIHPESPWVRAKARSNADQAATLLLNEINGTQGKPNNDDHPG